MNNISLQNRIKRFHSQINSLAEDGVEKGDNKGKIKKIDRKLTRIIRDIRKRESAHRG